MNEAINTKLTVNELNLILEALGNMPYYRVHELIYKIHSQAQEQVNSRSNGAAPATSDTSPVVKPSNGVMAD